MFVEIESELRRYGENPLADKLASYLRKGGKDIPSGESAFIPEQHRALERKGYFICRPLTGQSLASLRDAGYQFSSTLREKSFETIVSLLRTEVAINPAWLFLSGSTGKTLLQQLVMVDKFSEKISHEVPGTKAILGSLPDYAEVAFVYFKQRRQRLFGIDFDKQCVRTTTPISKSDVAIMGYSSGDYCPHISRLRCSTGRNNVWAVPLVVPSSALYVD